MIKKILALLSSVVLAVVGAIAFAIPASAYSTSYYGKNSSNSFTGAIFHACNKAGKIVGPARIAQKGKTVRIPGYVSGSLGLYIPPKSNARVTRNGLRTITYRNTSSRGRDFCGISRSAHTGVFLYK